MPTNLIVATVDCLIVINNKVLLIRRGKDPFKGKLVMPGGHVEEGEDLKAACCREVWEELGLVVLPEQLEFLIILENGDPRPGHSHSTVFVTFLDNLPQLKSDPVEVLEVVLIRTNSITKSDLGFSHFEAIECLQKKQKPQG